MELDIMKSPTTYVQQMEKLRSRGCEISDEQECIRLLAHINYYRLSGYLFPFRQDDDSYKPGTSLSTVFKIYEFDKKMRHLIFNALEEVEVSYRTRIAYFHAHEYGAIGYLNGRIFNKFHNHAKFLNEIGREKELNKKLPFVEHHNEKYSGNLPIWVAVELFTFGMLSKFYADMETRDRKDIVRRIPELTESNLKSWLRCCANLRNTCAHYGRLYYQKFTATPAKSNDFSMDENSETRLFGAVFALKKIYPDKDKWNREFIPPMATLIEEYQDYIELSHIGFTPNWKQELSN